MQAAFEVNYSPHDEFNGILHTIGTNWGQYISNQSGGL